MKIDTSGKVAYLCKTQKLAQQFLQECVEQGINWCSGSRADIDTYWDAHREDTCYNPRDGFLSYADRQYFINNMVYVIEYEGRDVKTMQELESENAELRAQIERSIELPYMFTREVVDIKGQSYGIVYNVLYKIDGKIKLVEYRNEDAAKAFLAQLK